MCRRYKGTNEFRDRTRARSCLGLIEQRRRKRAEQARVPGRVSPSTADDERGENDEGE